VRTASNATYRSAPGEAEATLRLGTLLRESPIPDDELARNSALYLRRQSLGRLVMFYELYRLQLDVHGVIAEFGCRFGQNLATFANLRALLEPYNYTRVVLGFDTFSGFASVADEDVAVQAHAAGDFGLPPDYASHLEAVLGTHESQSPLPHIPKFQLVHGDVGVSLPKYLDEHDETIFSMVYLDLDLYEPTTAVLQAIRSRLVKGSIVAFDELCVRRFPGETRAVIDQFGLEHIRLQRLNLDAAPSYFRF
jgi:hypothetical protein